MKFNYRGAARIFLRPSLPPKLTETSTENKNDLSQNITLCLVKIPIVFIYQHIENKSTNSSFVDPR